MSSPAYNPISQIPLFGRAFELTINLDGAEGSNGESLVISSTSWIPEPLRITFDISMPAYKAVWFAKIEIYNLNEATAQKILGQAALSQAISVVLKAGYQAQPYGIVFQGSVYQTLFAREDNVVDQKITLMCYTGLAEVIGNFASFQGTAFSTQAALVAKMASSAFTPIKVDTIDTSALSTTALPYPRPFFGDPNEFFDRLARANNVQSWYGFDGVNIGDLQNQNAISTLTYTPTTGILGTPQQTEDGIEFRVLMDARLRIQQPPIQVQINNAIIRQRARYPGDIPSSLDQDGLYIVMGLNFRGDSRSATEWYTDVIAVTSIGGKLAMLADAADPSVTLDRRSYQP